MNTDNYKLRWDLILKKEIDYLSKKYPDIDVKNNYTSIINLLEENKLKSKIIVNKNEFIGYAYVMNSAEKKDRLYADVGFISNKKINEDRLKTFFDWLIDISKKEKKKILLNPIFNGNDATDKYLINVGFKKMIRKKMSINLENFTYKKLKTNYEKSGVKNVSESLYSDAEYESFKYSSDKFLFSNIREDRINSIKNLLNGEYGKIIEEASIILKNKGRIIAGILSTQISFDKAFIVSIFVKKEHRKKGTGQFLLFSVLNILKALAFKQAYLWVNNDNFARDFYLKSGFVFDDYPEEIIYYYK